MWRKVEATVASFATSMGVFAQLAVLLARTMAKAVAITLCGAIILGVPLVAAYRWSGGSAVRYAEGAGVAIVALTFLPELLLRWDRKRRVRNATKS